MHFVEITRQYGKRGIEGLVCGKTGFAEITDDTQMTLFTAEGLLRAHSRFAERGICHLPTVVFNAYQRWIVTQGYPKYEQYDWFYDGWLIDIKELYARRDPGNTCLSTLLSRKMGTIEEPANNSKGCGGVMRVAPVGLFSDTHRAFEMAAELAAITHGHPSGYLSAGMLAYIIASIIEGQDIEAAVNSMIPKLKAYEEHEECLIALRQALELLGSKMPDHEAVETIGEGWVGEEALAISLYCALKYQGDFRKALIAAVNHGGDSDSTGSITGNIVGAYLGMSKIPEEWVDKLELKTVIVEMADDLLKKEHVGREWHERYPGY